VPLGKSKIDLKWQAWMTREKQSLMTAGERRDRAELKKAGMLGPGQEAKAKKFLMKKRAPWNQKKKIRNPPPAAPKNKKKNVGRKKRRRRNKASPAVAPPPAPRVAPPPWAQSKGDGPPPHDPHHRHHRAYSPDALYHLHQHPPPGARPVHAAAWHPPPPAHGWHGGPHHGQQPPGYHIDHSWPHQHEPRHGPPAHFGYRGPPQPGYHHHHPSPHPHPPPPPPPRANSAWTDDDAWSSCRRPLPGPIGGWGAQPPQTGLSAGWGAPQAERQGWGQPPAKKVKKNKWHQYYTQEDEALQLLSKSDSKCKKLKEIPCFIDLGAGTGVFGRAIRRIHPTAKVLEIDVDPKGPGIVKGNVTAMSVKKLKELIDDHLGPEGDIAVIGNPPWKAGDFRHYKQETAISWKWAQKIAKVDRVMRIFWLFPQHGGSHPLKPAWVQAAGTVNSIRERVFDLPESQGGGKQTIDVAWRVFERNPKLRR